MTSREFCYWLQGYFEILGPEANKTLGHGQVDTIQKHLSMVFVHEIDPSYPRDQQPRLDAAHTGSPNIAGSGGKANPSSYHEPIIRC